MSKIDWLHEKLRRLGAKIGGLETMEAMIRSHRTHQRLIDRLVAERVKYMPRHGD